MSIWHIHTYCVFKLYAEFEFWAQQREIVKRNHKLIVYKNIKFISYLFNLFLFFSYSRAIVQRYWLTPDEHLSSRKIYLLKLNRNYCAIDTFFTVNFKLAPKKKKYRKYCLMLQRYRMVKEIHKKCYCRGRTTVKFIQNYIQNLP